MDRLINCTFIDPDRHPITHQAVQRMSTVTGIFRTPMMALTGQQDALLSLLDLATPGVWWHSPESRQAAPGIWRLIDELGAGINALERCSSAEDIDAVERGLAIAWACNRFVGSRL